MLSVIIITKNEEALIRPCLESVQWADEIIVIDSGSTDKTVLIAKEYTPHVYFMEWPGYGLQKQRALEKASGDWVLSIDADERVSASLKAELQHAIQARDVDAYRIPNQLVFYDKPLKYSFYSKRKIRLFKRDKARFSNESIHESVILPADAKTKQLVSPLQHYSYRDLTHVLEKLNAYTSETANVRLKKNKKPYLLKIILKSTWTFLQTYGLRRGFLDGVAGFFMACLCAQSVFYREMKQHFRDVHLDQIDL